MKLGSLYTQDRTVIVAELGINHNRDPKILTAMVVEAATAGADAVKLSAYHTDEFVSDRAKWRGEKQSSMFRRYELERDHFRLAAQVADDHGLEWWATAQDIASAEMLLDLGVPCLKVGSDDLVHSPLLWDLAQLDVPIILSTGMADDDEIDEALGILDQDKTMLLHCVSIYPTPPKLANIKRIGSLREFGVEVGYSDHTVGHAAAVLSVYECAALVEKHFTIDKGLDGPDHSFSADPAEFRRMVDAIKDAEKMLGDGIIAPDELQKEQRIHARRSIVAARDLKAGEVVSDDELAFKRPGDGLWPNQLDLVLGYRLKRDVAKDEQIRVEDLE